MAMSFIQAFNAKERGAISWEDYIHCLFARCRGIGHEQDNAGPIHRELRRIDPFGYSIWRISDEMATVEDTSQHESVFKAYRRGTFDDVRREYALLQGPLRGRVLQPLALLALQERRPEVLKFCFDQGVMATDSNFYDEVMSVSQESDPETFRVIEQSGYARYNRTRATDDAEIRNRAAAIFDEGGKLPVNW